MTLVFRPFEAHTEIAEQRKLFSSCFPETVGHSAETQEFYFWKFHPSYIYPASYEYSAWAETKLVGYYSALPFSYTIGGKILICGMVCDVMTSTDMRGKGIFTKLGRYSIEQLKSAKVDFLLGYPIRKEVIPGHIKVGWRVAFDLPMYLFPLKTEHLLATQKLGWLSPLGNLITLLWRTSVRICNFGKIGYHVQICSIEELLTMHDFDFFIEAWKKLTPNALNKSKDFLKWRLGAPNTQYFSVTARNPQGVLNSIVIGRKVNLKNVPSIVILDWMTISVSLACNSVIRNALHKKAQQENAAVIVTMMSSYQFKRLGLLWQGFIRTPAVFKLIIKVLQDTELLEELLNEKHWSLMWIDSDDL